VQEGAKVLAVDNNLASAEETVAMARQGARERAHGVREDAGEHAYGAAGGGDCVAYEADVSREATLAAMVEAALGRWGRVDVLHYNVGVSIAAGDAPLGEITEAAFDRVATINLRGAIMACKHVLPVMRAQRSGVIITISSVAAWEQYPNVAYKATKAGIIAFTQQIAIQNAEFGVRANVILPGLMDTPMAVDTRARASGKSRAEVAAGRDARVPLRHKMGTAWDVANAALFLASDEANFITGVALPVDGGALVHINENGKPACCVDPPARVSDSGLVETRSKRLAAGAIPPFCSTIRAHSAAIEAAPEAPDNCARHQIFTAGVRGIWYRSCALRCRTGSFDAGPCAGSRPLRILRVYCWRAPCWPAARRPATIRSRFLPIPDNISTPPASSLPGSDSTGRAASRSSSS
jgi:NAD(P)-dependent dehydrogenase (short-subunit alcohol dehydrogenase family)